MTDSSLIDWQDGQPVSRLYGDVFFSRASGIEETRHVFLERNRLAERWAALRARQFIVGETGFGTGLNFLCAWKLWSEHAPAGAWLHFYSVEKHPLRASELREALALWPELAAQRDALLAQYRDLPPGWHRFILADARVTLTLAVTDVAEALAQLDVAADAWFLDGFSPARNPAMWTPEVLDAVAAHTRPGGTFATYTAAGEVRRGLQSAGFEVERAQGHGSKREMLCGVLREAPPVQPGKPWFARPAPELERHALVIGGGLAGTAAAASLALRGWRVDLLESYAQLATEASGNPQAMLYARLSAHATPLRDFLVSAYAYAVRSLPYARCGLLQLAFDEEEVQRQEALAHQAFPSSFLRAVDAAEAARLCGLPVEQSALWFDEGGWADPAALCETFAEHPNIRLHLNRGITALDRSGDGWRAMRDGVEVARAPALVLAGAGGIRRFQQSAHLPLATIRGQLTSVPATTESAALKAVVCGEGYLAPAMHGRHTAGATHKFKDESIDVREEEHEENLAKIAALFPGLRFNKDGLEGRAGLRISAPDYLPLVGPLADPASFNITYAPLANDATLPLRAPAPWQPGLYVSTAHGSRGLLSAPLAGELLAAYLNGEPAPLAKSTMDALHPSRFLLRKLIRSA
jgi:tRNA 5-methylaminomethyl-2-thiouridine biosynthesis bifunctional protein